MFDRRLDGDSITRLVGMGHGPEVSGSYEARLTKGMIRRALIGGMLPSEANRYRRSFDREDLTFLIGRGIWPDAANAYPEGLDGRMICVCDMIGLDPASASKRPALLKELYRVITQNHERAELSFVAVGGQGWLLREMSRNTAWKFSTTSEDEIAHLRRIFRMDPKPVNLMLPVEEPEEGSPIVKVEYIYGSIIRDIVSKGPISPDKVIEYSAGIMNGLVEMRRAGIWYHNDLSFNNVMIEQDTERPVIIDFGMSLADWRACPKGTKRFGGANDLVSLGQLMYYMATGDHLFDETGFADSNRAGPEIKRNRDYVYADHTRGRLESYISKVNERVGHKLGSLIEECLYARRYDYGRLNRVFKKCREV